MRAAEPSSCRSGLMGAATTTRGDHAAAAASSSIARLTAAARLRCRRNNIPPPASSVEARGSQLPTRRIDATGKSGFKTVSPESADAEQPQCSATSVFLALGPTGNGPRDSSFVHAHERPRAHESPAARRRALGSSGPASRPAEDGRRDSNAANLTVEAPPATKAYSVSLRYLSDATGRTAGLALSSLIARGARAPPHGSERATCAGSPTRASVPSPER
jgi:hypothetical protein